MNYHAAPLGTSLVYKWAASPLAALTDLGALSFNMVSGRMLGGTSKVNANLYTRSVPGEYNAWAAAGRKGWSWEEVEPFFNKSETSLTHGKSPHRGSTGTRLATFLLHHAHCVLLRSVAEPTHRAGRIPECSRVRVCIPTPSISRNDMESFRSINAAVELGIPYHDAANDPNIPAAAVYRTDHTIDKHSRRISTFDAFSPPHVWQRPNLTVCADVIVDSVDFEETPDGPRAVGVRLEYGDLTKASKSFYVKARHEIIVSGGSIGSSQLLMLR